MKVLPEKELKNALSEMFPFSWGRSDIVVAVGENYCFHEKKYKKLLNQK